LLGLIMTLPSEYESLIATWAREPHSPSFDDACAQVIEHSLLSPSEICLEKVILTASRATSPTPKKRAASVLMNTMLILSTTAGRGIMRSARPQLPLSARLLGTFDLVWGSFCLDLEQLDYATP
jgi:hypothetical protein